MGWTLADASDCWAFLVEVTALGPLVRSLPDAARDAVRAAINLRLEAFTGANGIALPSRCWGGIAIR